MNEGGFDRMQPTVDSTQAWTKHVDELFQMTLLRSETARSWYLGANIPGKPQRVLFYFGGAGAYFDVLEQSVSNDFEGFELSTIATPVALSS